jgi:hypothetical protein
MSAERKFKASGVNCFMKSTPDPTKQKVQIKFKEKDNYNQGHFVQNA